MEKPILSAKEAAEYLGVHVNTLFNWRKEGCSPPYFQPGRKVYYSREGLDEWIKQNMSKQPKPAINPSFDKDSDYFDPAKYFAVRDM